MAAGAGEDAASVCGQFLRVEEGLTKDCQGASARGVRQAQERTPFVRPWRQGHADNGG